MILNLFIDKIIDSRKEYDKKNCRIIGFHYNI